MVSGLRSRASWVLSLVGIIAIGILSRVVHTGFVVMDKYLGDALYAAMVYTILRMFWRAAPVVMAVSAMAVTDHDSGSHACEPASALADLRAADGYRLQFPGSAGIRGGHRVRLPRGFFLPLGRIKDDFRDGRLSVLIPRTWASKGSHSCRRFGIKPCSGPERRE